VEIIMNETVDTVSWLLAEMIKIQQRLKKLEKHSHVPVSFIEDENGFLRMEKKVNG